MRLPLTNLLLLAGKKYTVQLMLGANCIVAQTTKFLQASSMWKMNTNNSTNATKNGTGRLPVSILYHTIIVKELTATHTR